LPDDLLAGGRVEAQFRLRATDTSPLELEGGGQTTGFRLQSAATKSELALDTLPFSLLTRAPEKPPKKTRARRNATSMKAPMNPTWLVGPVPLKLGRPNPNYRCSVDHRSGYSVSLEEMPRCNACWSSPYLGIPSARPAATGSAKLDLRIAGQWSGFAGSENHGSAQLHSVQAKVRG